MTDVSISYIERLEHPSGIDYGKSEHKIALIEPVQTSISKNRNSPKKHFCLRSRP